MNFIERELASTYVSNADLNPTCRRSGRHHWVVSVLLLAAANCGINHERDGSRRAGQSQHVVLPGKIVKPGLRPVREIVSLLDQQEKETVMTAVGSTGVVTAASLTGLQRVEVGSVAEGVFASQLEIFFDRHRNLAKYSSRARWLLKRRDEYGPTGRKTLTMVWQEYIDNTPVLGAEAALHYRVSGDQLALQSVSGYVLEDVPQLVPAKKFTDEQLQQIADQQNPLKLVKEAISAVWVDMDHIAIGNSSQAGLVLAHRIPFAVSAGELTIDNPVVKDVFVDNDGTFLFELSRIKGQVDVYDYNGSSRTGRLCYRHTGQGEGNPNPNPLDEDPVNQACADAGALGREVEVYLAETFNHIGVDNNVAGTPLSFRMDIAVGGIRDDRAHWTGTKTRYSRGNVSRHIVAHEFAHGVVDSIVGPDPDQEDTDGSSSGFIYWGQSGAIDESFCDSFGALIDTDNWLVEDATGLPEGVIRSLEDPIAYGHPEVSTGYRCTDNDFGGVHSNSGIPNYAFYLIVEGGLAINDNLEEAYVGLGRDIDPESDDDNGGPQLLYNALYRMTSNATFADYAHALRTECAVLFPSNGSDPSPECKTVDWAITKTHLDYEGSACNDRDSHELDGDEDGDVTEIAINALMPQHHNFHDVEGDDYDIDWLYFDPPQDGGCHRYEIQVENISPFQSLSTDIMIYTGTPGSNVSPLTGDTDTLSFQFNVDVGENGVTPRLYIRLSEVSWYTGGFEYQYTVRVNEIVNDTGSCMSTNPQAPAFSPRPGPDDIPSNIVEKDEYEDPDPDRPDDDNASDDEVLMVHNATPGIHIQLGHRDISRDLEGVPVYPLERLDENTAILDKQVRTLHEADDVDVIDLLTCTGSSQALDYRITVHNLLSPGQREVPNLNVELIHVDEEDVVTVIDSDMMETSEYQGNPVVNGASLEYEKNGCESMYIKIASPRDANGEVIDTENIGGYVVTVVIRASDRPDFEERTDVFNYLPFIEDQ